MGGWGHRRARDFDTAVNWIKRKEKRKKGIFFASSLNCVTVYERVYWTGQQEHSRVNPLSSSSSSSSLKRTDLTVVYITFVTLGGPRGALLLPLWLHHQPFLAAAAAAGRSQLRIISYLVHSLQSDPPPEGLLPPPLLTHTNVYTRVSQYKLRSLFLHSSCL